MSTLDLPTEPMPFMSVNGKPSPAEVALEKWKPFIDGFNLDSEQWKMKKNDRDVYRQEIAILLEKVQDELTRADAVQIPAPEGTSTPPIPHEWVLKATLKLFLKLKVKYLFGLQPMWGPVGFAFMLRPKGDLNKELPNKEQIIQRCVDLYHVMPFKFIDKGIDSIDAVKEYGEQQFNIKMDEYEKNQCTLALTMEKTIVEAKSFKLEHTCELDGDLLKEENLDHHIKIIADEIDNYVFRSFLDHEVFKNNPMKSTTCKMTTKNLFEQLMELSLQIAVKNKRGPGNILVIPEKYYDKFAFNMEKYFKLETIQEAFAKRDQIYNFYEHQDFAARFEKIVVMPVQHMYLIYKGGTAYDGCAAYCPYILFNVFKTLSRKYNELSLEQLINEPELKLQSIATFRTRSGLALDPQSADNIIEIKIQE